MKVNCVFVDPSSSLKNTGEMNIRAIHGVLFILKDAMIIK